MSSCLPGRPTILHTNHKFAQRGSSLASLLLTSNSTGIGIFALTGKTMNFGERLREMREGKGIDASRGCGACGDRLHLFTSKIERTNGFLIRQRSRRSGNWPMRSALIRSSCSLWRASYPRNWKRSEETSRPGDFSIAQRRSASPVTGKHSSTCSRNGRRSAATRRVAGKKEK